MLTELPSNLRTGLLLYSYYNMIKNISLLQIDANFTAKILTHLKLLKLKQREILYREDDPSMEVYFISKGSVKLVSEDGEGIFSFIEGTYFGELEILDNVFIPLQIIILKTKRICFCQASQSTVLLVCDRKYFLNAMKDFPAIQTQVPTIHNLLYP